MQLRQRDGCEHEVGLALHVLEGVLGEPLELVADAGARFVHPTRDLVGAEDVTAAELLAAGQHGPVVEADLLTVRDGVHDRRTDVVDQQHARPDEAHRSAVRIPPRDRRGGVDHGDDAGVDQAVRRDAVDVGVVDDRDIAGFEALREVLGALADPGSPHHAGPGAGSPPSDPHHRPRSAAAVASSSSAWS